MNITSDIKYIGVNDHTIDLFEGIYKVPNGMSYNSYVILDEKIAVMDTVDEGFTNQWFQNMESVLGNRTPDYLVIQHMEPDHSANIINLVEKYPKIVLVASSKAFEMMRNYFGETFAVNKIVVSDGDMISLGKHKLKFATAPMVHWPEVIVTFDSTDKVLFTADGFGKFGALDIEDDWVNEARRYYFGIVGKYGLWVQKLFQKINDWDIQVICPLHGPILSENLEYYIGLYQTWSTYQPEEEGILIAYTSVYGHTKQAVMQLKEKLQLKGCNNVIVNDLARCDMTETVAEAFRYSKLVLATTTYNAEMFPPMREFIHCLLERNFSNRVVGLIGNGSWSPIASMLMKEKLEKCKGLVFAEPEVKIVSALNNDSLSQLEILADELCKK